MAKALTRIPVIYTVDVAGKQNTLTGGTMNIVEHVAGVTGDTVTVSNGDIALVCEDSTATGIYTVGNTEAGGWVKQSRQPRRGDLVEVTGGTLYAGMLLVADGEGGFTPVGEGSLAALATRVDALE